ncbi:MAG TPA: hypothetical protein VMT91_03615 [Anaerolineales bacterium]|nr:hypothetical protein [Anaerolineales bacterium]
MNKTRSNDFGRSLPGNKRLKPLLQVSRQHKMFIQNWRKYIENPAQMNADKWGFKKQPLFPAF